MSSCNEHIEHIVIGCLVHASMIHVLPIICETTDADVIIIGDHPDTSHRQWPVFDFDLPVIELAEPYLEKNDLIFHDYVNKFEHSFEHVFIPVPEHGRVRIRSPGNDDINLSFWLHWVEPVQPSHSYMIKQILY